jgi:hypothetical protein
MGCMDSSANNYNADATIDDATCTYDVMGCMDSSANNYNSDATIDDASCTYDVMGCMDPTANNYNADATIDDATCTYDVMGCMDSSANNYNADATIDDASCTYDVMGCMDSSANNYNADATIDDATCTYDVMGCMDSSANNYNSDATVDDASCTYDVMGCMDPTANNYNADATVDDATCTYDVMGCMDSSANNYNAAATIDDASCTYDVMGCMDSSANNYNADATVDDASCTYDVMGCMDSSSNNYNTNATVDDGSCDYTFTGNWPSSPAGITNTGNNSTIGITGSLDLDDGDYLGAFYEAEGELVCGGLLIWNSNTENQLIVVWGNDANSATIDGFASGDQIIWKSKDISSDVELNLHPIYTIGNNTYMVNAAYIISDWIIDPEFGCMNLAYQEYATTALVDDGSCSVLWSTLYAQQADELSQANTQIDELSTNIFDLNNTLSTTILSMQSDYDDIVLDYQGQLFDLETSLTDSLEGIHAYYITEIAALNSSWGLEVTDLELDLSVLNQGLADSITSYELQLTTLTNLMNEEVASLESDIISLQANNSDLTENLAYHSAAIYTDLNEGWNMIGFPLQEEMDAAASLEVLGDAIHLIKNNNAAVYWPEFGFNSLGTLVPGQGYQVRMYESYAQYTFPYISGERLDVYPQVPTWALEMEIPLHPNDTPTLVRVVNMLGQEVNPDDVFDGEILLYLYSNGTVEKTIK